jgi:hypothetical protein
MAIAPFESHQFYDEVVAVKLQSVFGTGVTPDNYLGVNSFMFLGNNMEISSYGTTRSRGLRSDQRTKSGRVATFQMQTDLMNTADIKELIEWSLGDDEGPTDAVKFASLGWRKTGGQGSNFTDCVVTETNFIFSRNETAKVLLSGMVMSDWDIVAPVAAGVPVGGARVQMEGSTLTVMGTELPFENAVITVAQGVNPIFANNAFPVSYEVVPYRQVTLQVTMPATSTTFDMIEDYRDDVTGDIVFATSGMTFTLNDCTFTSSSGSEFTGSGIAPVIVSFQAHKPDAGTEELEISYA